MLKTKEELLKAIETTTNEEVIAMVGNENVTEVSDKEKLSVLVFNELEKALTNDATKLLLDCNFPSSGNINKKDPADNVYKVDYYRLVSKTTGKSMVQFYVLINMKNGEIKFNLCTSCAKMTRIQLEAMKEELKFNVLKRKDGTPKTSERKGVDYAEIVDVVKSVCGVLATTEAQVAKAKAEKPKADKKEEKKEEKAQEEKKDSKAAKKPVKKNRTKAA